MKKSEKYGGLGQENEFWLSIIAQFAVAGKRRSKVVHM
jgi:hypothetical protein